MPLFAPVMRTRLPAIEGMSAACQCLLISVLDVGKYRFRCELFPLNCMQTTSRLALTEKCVNDLHVFVRLFVGGQMAALFEDDDLRTGDWFLDAPWGEGGKGGVRLFGCQVERSGCFLYGGACLWGGSEIFCSGEVGIAICFAIE